MPTTPKPAYVAGHLTPSVARPVHPIIVQELGDATDSTRRATLIFNNGKGETLYYENGPGYFVVYVSRFIGSIPAYAIKPLSDVDLKQWATTYSVIDRVTTKTAQSLVNKLMATPDGAARLSKLIRKHA